MYRFDSFWVFPGTLLEMWGACLIMIYDESLILHYTIVLKNDQLAANPVPRAAPTIAGLIPAVHQYNPCQYYGEYIHVDL